MAGSLNFQWNARGGSERVRVAAARALTSLQPVAHEVWDSVVPVRTGALKASWYAIVQDSGVVLVLTMGATVHYAIFVEAGTIHMAPRYPLRRTAQAIAPLVLPRLIEELRAA